MGSGNITHKTPDSPIGDIAYLVRSEHRIPALVALTERPWSRAELCELTGVSASTIRRTVAEFEDRLWIRKDGCEYVATRLGEAIAAGAEEMIKRVETERQLRDLWHMLPDAVSEFPIETWSDLNVTAADPTVPYRPVIRFKSLLEKTTTLRYLRPQVALMDPCFDRLYQQVHDGVDVTLIDRPNSHTYFVSTYPERSAELGRRSNFSVLEHDDLPPYGIGLLDECVTISCYEQDSGTVRAMIDTDVPVVRDWARSAFERYRRDARPVDPTRSSHTDADDDR